MYDTSKLKSESLQKMVELAIENMEERECWVDCKCLNCLADGEVIKTIHTLRDEVAQLTIQNEELRQRYLPKCSRCGGEEWKCEMCGNQMIGDESQ